MIPGARLLRVQDCPTAISLGVGTGKRQQLQRYQLDLPRIILFPLRSGSRSPEPLDTAESDKHRYDRNP